MKNALFAAILVGSAPTIYESIKCDPVPVEQVVTRAQQKASGSIESELAETTRDDSVGSQENQGDDKKKLG